MPGGDGWSGSAAFGGRKSATPSAMGYWRSHFGQPMSPAVIVRPDRRQYALLDHIIEFKHLKIKDLPGIDSEALAVMPREGVREVVVRPVEWFETIEFGNERGRATQP